MATAAEINIQDKRLVEINKHGIDKKEKPPTKIIIRRLPPKMDAETFLNQISPVPLHDYFYMVKGDPALGENAFTRAYINFINPNDVYSFKLKFDNYVFLDDRGHEYPAVVEFAPFQKIPKKRNKIRTDPKCGTIETDPVYTEFIELLNKPKEIDKKPEYSLQLNNNESKGDETTPLLEFIKTKRAERLRIREERREERKRREFERKKYKDDDHKKQNIDLKAFPKPSPPFAETDLETIEKCVEKIELTDDKPPKYEKVPFYKNRDRRFDDRRNNNNNNYMKDMRPKFQKKPFIEKREYKRRDDFNNYRPKYDDYNRRNNEQRFQQKKVKKYSEKREELKMEAQAADNKKTDKIALEPKPSTSKDNSSNANKEQYIEKNTKLSDKNNEEIKPNDNQNQKRIRNKDRPTIAIYRPGMLSKRKQTDTESENKEMKPK